MTVHDPRPLKADPHTPPELARALRALRNSAADAARLQRVEHQLGSLLDAPPPPPPSWARLGQHKLTLAKLMLAAVAAYGVALWSDLYAPPARPVDGMVAPSPAPSAAPEQAFAPPTATHDSRSDAERSAGIEPSVAPQAGLAPRQARRTSARRAAERAAATRQAVVTGAGETSASSADVVVPVSVEPEPPRDRVEAPAMTESALLFEARRAALRDRGRAIALLEEHSLRFPEGTLRPERELLTIELWRASGRVAEAERRAQAFRARYPGSIHLPRLEGR